MFLDSDDELLPGGLQVLVETLQSRPEAGVSYGGFYMMHVDGRPGTALMMPRLQARAKHHSPWPDHDPVAYGLDADGEILSTILQYDAMVMGATLVRASVLDRVGGFDTSIQLMEHLELFLRISHNGFPFAAAHVPIVRLRNHGGNVKNHENMLRDRLSLIEKYFPVDDPDAERIRSLARTNAFFMHGLCLMALGHVDRGLSCIGTALSSRPLVESAYDSFTGLACKAAFSSDDPDREIQRVLAALGASRHALSLKHFVLSRFYRVRATQSVRQKTSTDESPRIRAGTSWGLSGWHLARAVLLRPVLGQMYARRLLKKIRSRRFS
jgi:hypothetical protein